jgi:hypothetical protein
MNGYCSFPFGIMRFWHLSSSVGADSIINCPFLSQRPLPSRYIRLLNHRYMLTNSHDMSTYNTNSSRLCRSCAFALRIFGYVPGPCRTCQPPSPPPTASRLRQRERRRQEATRYKSKHSLPKGPFETERRRATQGPERSPVRNALQRPLGRARSKSQPHAKPHAARPQAWLSRSPANRPLYVAAGFKVGEDLYKFQENLFRGLFFTPQPAQDHSLSITAPSTPPRRPQGWESPEGRDLVLKDGALVPEPKPSDVLFESLIFRLQLNYDDLSPPTPPSTPHTPPPSGGSSGSSTPSGGSEGSSK